MPNVSLSAFAGVGAQLFDNNGAPLAGGKIYSYYAGTTTPLATYTSDTGITAHTNPIILNAAGRVPTGEIWIESAQKYKFIVKTSADVLISTYDNVGSTFNTNPNVDDFIGDGVTKIFTLTTSATTTDVYINGVYQQKASYSLSSDVITFSEAPPATSTIEVVYV